jgi:hypothetical protein
LAQGKAREPGAGVVEADAVEAALVADWVGAD